MGRENRGSRSRRPAVVLAFISQGIHLWILPGQLAAAVLPGVFFFWVAMGQGLLGAALICGGGRWTARFGVLLNVFVILVWLLTRAVSIPQLFEPIKLPVENLGALASATEAALIVALLRLKSSLPRREKRRRNG